MGEVARLKSVRVLNREVRDDETVVLTAEFDDNNRTEVNRIHDDELATAADALDLAQGLEQTRQIEVVQGVDAQHEVETLVGVRQFHRVAHAHERLHGFHAVGDGIFGNVQRSELEFRHQLLELVDYKALRAADVQDEHAERK